VSFSKYNKLPKELKVISWYLFIGAITSIIYNTMGFQKVNNMPLAHLYTVVEFTVLVLFYHRVMDKTGLNRFILWLIPLFVAFAIINALFFQSIFIYNTYTKSVEAIVIIFLSISYFIATLDKIGKSPERTSVIPYINSGLLLYFSGSFILFVIFNMTLQNRPFGLFMWGLHATFLLFLYILIAIALWKHKE
jgi:hypothetical protein